MSTSKKPLLLALLALIILFLPQLVQLYTDYLWFDAQLLSSVYWTTISYQIGTFIAATILVYTALHTAINWSENNIRKQKKDYTRNPATLPLAGFVALLTAGGYSTQWDVVLRYANSFEFSAADPIFNNNIAFYVYNLPFYELLISLLTTAATLALITALILYATNFKKKTIPDVDEDIIQPPQTSSFELNHYLQQLKKHSYNQLLILVSIILLLTAASYYLQRYELLFSSAGTVFGIGFTEHYVRLPALWILTILAATAAALLLINTKQQKDGLVILAVVALIAASLLASGVAAGVQALIVEPDEINKEHDYIAHEIHHTRQGFGLDRVTAEQLDVNRNLSREQLRTHQPTIDNARLWDDRPLLRTLNELQIFRTYYHFPNIDVDRYTINGERQLMMLASREIDISGLEQRSQTWVNRHLVYTHGFGVTMNPASQVTSGNLPELIIQDIPPRSTQAPQVTEPRIYYGAGTQDYAIVNTQTAELDYPAGDENVRINYPGEGGVLLDSLFKQLAYAAQLQAPQILFSDSITQESRIQYHRQISERTQKLAPFLQYDNDPYIVVGEDGALYWIQDAYTTTNKYPYSNPINFHGQATNYVRNSAKAVINAYDGEVTFYITEPNDPLINTYRQAYPDLFKDLEEMPEDLQEHIRYPQDIFSAQAHRYQDYHMQDPSVFYNREDAWRIPNEVVRGIEQTLQPYYQIMQLPGYEEAEFIQVQPFIPRGRENLIGWLAARSDQPNYGELKAYHFSKQELTYGPMQIESRIDQDADISQQITLWSSAGSGVVRGNLLVIPIDDTILYVEPLFLEAREQGALPQLMRVIVVHEERIAMAPTLQAALQAITDPEAPTTPIIEDPEAPELTDEPTEAITDPQLIQEIREAFQKAQEALQEGDLRLYAQRLEEIEALLE